MPPCCSGCPLARHVIVKSSLVFFIVSFPAPRFLCHGFRENLKIFFCRTLPERPTTDFAHLVYQQIFWNPAEDSAKNRHFSRHQSHHVRFRTQGISGNNHENWRSLGKKIAIFSAPPARFVPATTLYTGYIWEQNRDPIEIHEKIVTFYAADHPVAGSAHWVYLGINTKSGRDSQKKSLRFRGIRCPRPTPHIRYISKKTEIR